jgi:hypothetical protein
MNEQLPFVPPANRSNRVGKVTQTHGLWAGVATLERVKARGHVPPKRPAGIRKPNKVGR